MNKQSRSPVMPGDIIGITRWGYEHYGIYCGNNRVVHFTSLQSDVSSSNNMIVETGMSVFMRGQTKLFILDVEKLIDEKQIFSYLLLVEGKQYRIFEGSETVRRARSMLGKTNYDLLYNNCEHFVMWCRAGVPEMNQHRLFHRIRRYKTNVSYKEIIGSLHEDNEIYSRKQEMIILQDSEAISTMQAEVEILHQEAERLAVDHKALEKRISASDDRMGRILGQADEYLNNNKLS
ncbi:lecithin retinol acyltransferase family protein [Cohnella sp. WQ 127256]|uniref:lecithin retinol acyltransferase family protein n=1 Tax=Cohnella sp. WQ 127256 TaxID=2938790 RepID=UPI002118998C|nr:lecithin retinol acyltransferase family protein [Cohnella sp. WQ 127256]